MAKPKNLTRLTLLMCVLNIAAYLYISGNEQTKIYEIILFTIWIGLRFFILFNFHKGFNWARIAIMIFSGFFIINLLALDYFYYTAQAILIIEAILGTYLLYYLNSQPVKEYFNQKKKSIL